MTEPKHIRPWLVIVLLLLGIAAFWSVCSIRMNARERQGAAELLATMQALAVPADWVLMREDVDDNCDVLDVVNACPRVQWFFEVPGGPGFPEAVAEMLAAAGLSIAETLDTACEVPASVCSFRANKGRVSVFIGVREDDVQVSARFVD